VTDVEAARRSWIAERARFAEFGELIAGRLRVAVRRSGIFADVSARAKELDSLVRKLLLKPAHSYDSLPDKVGVRIVLRHRSEIPVVQAIISGEFDHDLADDKARDQGTDRVGYLSVHLDHMKLRADDQRAVEFPPSKFFAEVQLRTLAQHLWAEISHDDVYKNDETAKALPADLRRRINLMAGQVEVADREFDRITKEIGEDDAYRLLKALEKYYFKLTTRRPNPELSLFVIKLLAPTFKNLTATEIINQIEETFTSHADMLEKVYQDPDRAADPSAFFFQPEALLIYDRLLNDRDETLSIWNTALPASELDRVANNFGLSLD
jgi:ppGpp synthetase/RelA/SpoT-type nucleotidyltranferase